MWELLTAGVRACCRVVFAVRCYAESLGKPKEFRFTIDGESFFVHKNTSDMFVIREVWKYHSYPLPDTGAIVVDIGANIGAFTVYAARRAKHVYAFEPLPSNYMSLEKNVQGKDNVTIYQQAVAAQTGSRTLHRVPVNPGRTSFFGSGEAFEVSCISLDDLFSQCAIEKIDFLKMDIEGAEYEILLNATDTSLQRIKRIIMEFHDEHGSHRYPELVRRLEKSGFHVELHMPYYWPIRTGMISATHLPLNAMFPSDAD